MNQTEDTFMLEYYKSLHRVFGRIVIALAIVLVGCVAVSAYEKTHSCEVK